jgi:hypothetical protein
MTISAKYYSIILYLLSFIILHGTASSCVPILGKKGNVHYLILGFGIVTVNESSQAVTATDIHALGISASDQPGLKLAVGYSSSTIVSVTDGAEDVRVEVSKIPGSPIVVDVPRAIRARTGVPRGDIEDEAIK